jgi:hypothetical protein
VDDGKTGADLAANRGYLVVRFPADGNVYITITEYGPVNTKLEVPCGSRFVRVGTGKKPQTKWLSKGQPVAVKCQAVTTVELKP